MKTLFFALALLFATPYICAQNVTKKGNVITQVAKNTKGEKKASEAKKTDYTFVVDGKSYPVYKGAKGGYYILRVSKKTGKEYKYYVTKQLKEVGIK